MKKSRFTDEQIAFALKQAETGTRIDEICRKMGISQATFYAWRKKFGGLGVAELRRLRQLEEENRKLKQADQLGKVLKGVTAAGKGRARVATMLRVAIASAVRPNPIR